MINLNKETKHCFQIIIVFDFPEVQVPENSIFKINNNRIGMWDFKRVERFGLEKRQVFTSKFIQIDKIMMIGL